MHINGELEMNSEQNTIDETEQIARRRALANIAKFKHASGFDIFNAGYIQAMEDIGVDRKFISIYRKICIENT
jgi:hypothetical protein